MPHLTDETRKRIRLAVRMASQRDIPQSDSSSEEEELPFVRFQDRSEWNDVLPEPQDEGPDPVAVIAYTDRFRNTFDYFRAILRMDERSERAFNLTTECCHLNPANYTVWYFRRILLKDLHKDLSTELAYISDAIRSHPKNYQVWQHRKCVVQELNDASHELAFTAEILGMDAKNYHSWQHRQWVLISFRNWDQELKFADSLITEDVRNNSAWNHKYFVLKNTTGFTSQVLEREISFTIQKIRLTPNNESAWNFLRGLMSHNGLNSSPQVTEMCQQMLQNPGPRPSPSPHVVAFVVDAAEQRLEAGGDVPSDLLNQTIGLCDKLATEWDTIRVNYWNYMRDNLKAKYS